MSLSVTSHKLANIAGLGISYCGRRGGGVPSAEEVSEWGAPWFKVACFAKFTAAAAEEHGYGRVGETFDLCGFDVLFAGAVTEVQEDVVVSQGGENLLVHRCASNNTIPSFDSIISVVNRG